MLTKELRLPLSLSKGGFAIKTGAEGDWGLPLRTVMRGLPALSRLLEFFSLRALAHYRSVSTANAYAGVDNPDEMGSRKTKQQHGRHLKRHDLLGHCLGSDHG